MAVELVVEAGAETAVARAPAADELAACTPACKGAPATEPARGLGSEPAAEPAGVASAAAAVLLESEDVAVSAPGSDAA